MVLSVSVSSQLDQESHMITILGWEIRGGEKGWTLGLQGHCI